MSFSPQELDALLHSALALSIQAGRAILEVYRQGFEITQKGDLTPVTTADLAAHRVIMEGLSQLPTQYPILSEESESIPASVRRAWTRYWLIDPLDGTREFIRHSNEFSVNIALIDDHEPILGVVHAPALGHSYFALRGQGAFKQILGESPTPIRARPLGNRRPVVAASHSHRSALLQDFLQQLGEHRLITMGSALKSCLVAEGVADLYVRLGPTSEWDTAAAQCIVQEAGGHMTDTHMQPLRYNARDSLLNPHFFVYGADSRDWSKYLQPARADTQ